MAGRFARLRRTRDDDPTPTDAHGASAPTEAAEPVDASATADGADQPTEALPAAEPAADATADGTAATELQVVDPEAQQPEADPAPEGPPGFLARGRLRRRLRYVRRAREIALRDLGGLVFDLHRFGRDRGDLVEQKLAGLTALDAEMRALEAALEDRREVTVLREPGLTSCPRCGALQASDARYCSSCGLPLDRSAALPAGPTPAGGPAPTEPTAPQPPAAPATDEPTTPVP